MNIKSSILNKKKNIVKADTVYMNTDDLFCFNVKKNINTGKNIKNIIVSKKLIEEELNVITIYDTKATNLYFEGQANFGDISIPIELICENDIDIEINNEIIYPNFNKINIINNNEIILEIELEYDIKEINISKDNDCYDLYIRIKTDNEKVLKYYINKSGTYFKQLYAYKITEDDLDFYNNIDIRSISDYGIISCEQLDINTLIVDKKIFEDINKYNCLGLSEKTETMPNIKYIRFIEDNDMKLLPFDKLFEIKEVLLDSKTIPYLYIKTNDDEVVLYIKNSKLYYISKNDLLKDQSLEEVYFRFRKLSNDNGGIFRPLNLIIKKYNDGRILVNNLSSEYEINERFKNNIISNIDKLKLPPDFINYINADNWLGLLLDIDFYNGIYLNMLSIHSEEERHVFMLDKKGLNEYGIEYLKLRGLLLWISKLELTKEEIKSFNELGEIYIKKKTLQKSGDINDIKE